MKKFSRYILLTIISLCLITGAFLFSKNAPVMVNAATSQPNTFYIENYDINIVVNENNTFKITEKIDMHYTSSSHGFFRDIPLYMEVTREDGTKNKIRADVSDLEVDAKFSTSRSYTNYEVKIGDANKTIIGDMSYEISYLYNIGPDKSENYDEFYFNLIGTGWNNRIDHVTFTITMPKAFDSSKVGFSTGLRGSAGSDIVDFTVNDNVISGETTSLLYPNQAMTIRLELDEGYFVGAVDPYDNSISNIVGLIIPPILVLIAFILWYKFGKDKFVPETVEFYPPEGLNSLDVAFIYKDGKCSNKDVLSLIIDLANKKYLKIIEGKRQSSLGTRTEDVLILIKEKDYDGDNRKIRNFFDCLFTSWKPDLNKIDFPFDKISQTEIESKQYTIISSTVNTTLSNNVAAIQSSLNTKTNKEKYFTSSAGFKVLLCVLAFISFISMSLATAIFSYGNVAEIIVYVFPLFAFGVVFSNKELPIIIRLIICCMFGGIPVFGVLSESFSMYGLPYTLLTIWGWIGGGTIFAFVPYMQRKTPLGDQLHAKIRGFRKFIMTAEKSRLEMMQSQDAEYFYNILPYAYVLGVSNEWLKNFSGIVIPASTQVITSSTTIRLNTFSVLSRTSSSISRLQAAERAARSSSGGGGFSGGGSSGGGSGGGGGRSW